MLLEPSILYDWSVHNGDKEQWIQQSTNEAEVYLDRVARRYARHSVTFHKEVVSGAAEEKILAFAHLHNIDLIAMSTHGHSGLRRWMYGSVTAKVMHSFEGHMLIVRPPDVELS